MYFKWKEEYCTGIEAIDRQHRHLLEIGSGSSAPAYADDGCDHYDEIMEVLYELRTIRFTISVTRGEADGTV